MLCDGLRQNRSVARSSSSGVQTRAGVADRDLHPAVAPRGVHRDRVARRRELHGVVEHGVQHGLDGPDRRGDRQARLPVELQPQPGVLGQRSPGLDPVAHRGVDVHLDQGRGPLRAGQRQQAVEQLREPLGLLQRGAVVVDRRAVDVSLQVGQAQPQCGQRVAQLVARVGDERALRGERPGHGLGHPVERHREPAQLRRAAVVGDRLGRAPREDGRRDPAGALVEPAHGVQDPADDRQGHEHAQRERQQDRGRDQRPRLQLAPVQRGGGRDGDDGAAHLAVDQHRLRDHQRPAVPRHLQHRRLRAAPGERRVEPLAARRVERGGWRSGRRRRERCPVGGDDVHRHAVDLLVAVQQRVEVRAGGVGQRPLHERGEVDGVGEAAREEPLLLGLRSGVGEQATEPERDEADDDQHDHQEPGAHAYSAGEVVPASASIPAAIPASGTPSR